MLIQTAQAALEVELRGSSEHPAVILIAGLGFQLIDWPDDFCDSLVGAGYQVIRFDNRDIGLSQKFDAAGLPDLGTVMADKMAGHIPDTPYSLSHMAQDVTGLLGALGIEKVHIVGMSMGGMIAQLVAAHAPGCTASLTSIMSSSSDPALPGPTAPAMQVLSSAPQSQERADIVAFGLEVNDVIGSPSFRWPRVALTRHIEACVERSYSPAGYVRQYAAVMAAPSRRELLAQITAPTLVVHGDADPLVPASCGKDVADHVPDARFVQVSGMGHDLSPALCQHLVRIIIPHLDRAEA